MNKKKPLIKCYRCSALYKDTQWVRGYDTSRGTEPSAFQGCSLVKKGDCPFCNKPPLLEPYPKIVAM